jgi:hypothetical protein
MRLVQFVQNNRYVGLVEDSERLRIVRGFSSVYEMAISALRRGTGLASLVESNLSDEIVDYGAIVSERRLLPPLDHPDPARCIVSLTGLTHLGSAASRDKMHTANSAQPEKETDSIRMFRLGIAGGKPEHGQIGTQPEWAYKGDGRCVVSPEQPLIRPAYADDGGEEAEIAGLYVIDDAGQPWRVGFALGNEFSDHMLEKKNYLYLAHSKLRQCSFGPELFLGAVSGSLRGTVRIVRDGKSVWSSEFHTGEENMCHSIANLEHHHFKYEMFRRPGDVHVHFFGANAVSFGDLFQVQAGDVFEIDLPAFGRPLRNPLQIETSPECFTIRSI